jgi:SAM-dependent methyltransferase
VSDSLTAAHLPVEQAEEDPHAERLRRGKMSELVPLGSALSGSDSLDAWFRGPSCVRKDIGSLMLSERLRAWDRRSLDRLQSQYLDALDAAVSPGSRSLLDVGCGVYSPVEHLLPRLSWAVGVDLVERPREAGGRPVSGHHAFVRGDIRELAGLFRPDSFDVVAALDVIEHLDKKEGLQLIEAAESIARSTVIFFTPNGFLPQSAFDGNPHQIHRSGWTVEEFRSRGYEVVGIHGWRPLRTERATIAWRPHRLWGRVSLYTQALVKERPHRAFQLLCVKRIAANILS